MFENYVDEEIGLMLKVARDPWRVLERKRDAWEWAMLGSTPCSIITGANYPNSNFPIRYVQYKMHHTIFKNTVFYPFFLASM